MCTEFRERILKEDIERAEVRLHEGVVNLEEEEGKFEHGKTLVSMNTSLL